MAPGITLRRTNIHGVLILRLALVQRSYVLHRSVLSFPFTRFLHVLQRAKVSQTQSSSLFFAMILTLS